MRILSGLMWFCWGVSAMACYTCYLTDKARIEGQHSVECRQDMAGIKQSKRMVET